tara:strand:+ start:94 stop:474 length:381 start_codon:yes stop_codon:yes gene_type:complete
MKESYKFLFLFSFILFPFNSHSLDDVTTDIFRTGCVKAAKEAGKNQSTKLNETVINLYCDCVSQEISERFTNDSLNKKLHELEKKWIKQGKKGNSRNLLWEDPMMKNLIITCFESITKNYDGPLYE